MLAVVRVTGAGGGDEGRVSDLATISSNRSAAFVSPPSAWVAMI
jgi:hypothetical protein